MVKRRNTRRGKKSRGRRGPRGKVGPPGKMGPRGLRGPASSADHVEVIRLSAQMNDVMKELRVQLTRIAQIQAQLDHFAAGQPPAHLERRAIKRTNH
jgi:hypothetical protein